MSRQSSYIRATADITYAIFKVHASVKKPLAVQAALPHQKNGCYPLARVSMKFSPIVFNTCNRYYQN